MIQPATHPATATALAAPTTVITLFTCPKPMRGEAAVMQRNAIRSWSALAPEAEIVLFGDEPELVALAEDVGARHLAVEVNARGTPRLQPVFDRVHEVAGGSLLAYVNSDIVLGRDFVEAARRLRDSGLASFLAIGRRTELDVADEWPADKVNEQLRDLWGRAERAGRPASIVCKDYFLFTPGLFRSIPDFVVGRGNWDNWMVRSAKRQRIPVVDLSRVVRVVHPSHGYGHVPGGRWAAYVRGCEARENQRQAGGRHLVSGSTANWELHANGLLRRRWPAGAMLRDLPRFLGLMRNLLFMRYIFALSALQQVSGFGF